MSDLKICRICLRTECKVYKYDRYQLKSYYEEVLALKVNDSDGLPHYFCYECATMLHKFHKFKEKCYVGQQLLREISWRGPMTYEAVYKVDRKAKNLTSPIEVLTTARKRVKTYNEAARPDDSDNESESESDTEKPIEMVDMYLSDNSVMDNDLIDPETDPVDENVSINDEVRREIEEEDAKIEIDDEVKPAIDKEDAKIEIDEPTTEQKSSETVFVAENITNTLKKEFVKEKRKKFAPKKSKATKCEPRFARKGKIMKKWNIDMNNWKKSSLSEEEALERFRKRAEDPKYIKAPYKCSECFKGFSKEEMLKRHQVLRHAESKGAVECRFCKMRFKWECHLRKHMRAHYTKYECLRCDLVCSLEQSAILHEECHSGVKKTCAYCGDEFKHVSTYYTHLRTHRSTHLCTLCGASFVSQLGLQMHKKVKHVDGEIDSPDEDAPVSAFCEKCDINFETRKAYEEHLFHSAMHTDVVVDQVEDPSLANVPRKVLGKKLQAKITNELKGKITKIDGFDVAPARKRTRRLVRRLRKKPTTCHQCGKHFETQSACMKHHLAEHPRTSFCPPSERHICEICGVSLAPGSVATHQNIHSREKVHSCDICGRSFHSSVGLKRHLVTHTGEKPYACTLCEKRFTQSNSMKLHYRTFHLKQPYPKRNRRKKKDEQPEPERPVSTSDSGSQSAPEAPQYMTLSTGQYAVTLL